MPLTTTHLLFALAVVFALISGANDGASLLAANLSGRAFSPLTALALLTLIVIVGPFAVGTAVATTFARGLVTTSGSEGTVALAVAVGAAIAVITWTARSGLPTSVTQALLGGIVGAGLGLGFPVAWGTVALVLALFAAAPLAAAGLAWGLTHVLLRLPVRRSLAARLRNLHAVGFAAQAIAYASNDAQKLVAVFAVAAGSAMTGGTIAPDPRIQLLIGVCFAVGSLAGAASLGGRLGGKLLVAGPLTTIAADFGSAVAVAVSALMGSPVSTPQAASAAMIGSTIATSGRAAVRWPQAWRLVLVWFTTLPTAIALAAGIGLLIRS